MWLNLWVPGITSLNYSLNKYKVSVEVSLLSEKLSVLIKGEKSQIRKKKRSKLSWIRELQLTTHLQLDYMPAQILQVSKEKINLWSFYKAPVVACLILH